MTVNPRRRYHSPARSDQANATRRLILASAAACFAERSFSAVTVAEIAEQAGVSLATVYLYFPGKASIVTAMAEDIAQAPDLSVEQVERLHDPVSDLQVGAGIMRRLNERSWLVAEILRQAHGADPQLAEALTTWRQRHLAAISRSVAVLTTQGSLRDGLTPEEAIDMLYALAGIDVYRALVRERGWSPERYEQWLFGIACLELLGRMPQRES